MNVNSPIFKKKCRFQLSLRYELFLAIGNLAGDDSDLHVDWRHQAKKQMSDKLSENLKLLGSSSDLWSLFATVLPIHKSNPVLEEIINDLRQIEPSEFQTQILKGLIHDEALSRKAVLSELTLKEAINSVGSKKREWLTYMGLYPYDKNQRIVSALELLISHPELFRRLAIESIQMFWDEIFQTTWCSLERAFMSSLEKTEKMFADLSFEEFAERRLLKITFSEDLTKIAALRGGYQLPLGEIENCIFMPSIFNERRFWSALQLSGKKSFVYFPYLDPSISLSDSPTTSEARSLGFDLDPALIFKVLGDSTRFAIVTSLKAKNKTATEIADDLGLSKATVSHHLALLREAKIIQSDLISMRNAPLKIDEGVIGSISSIYLHYLNTKTKRRK